MYNPINLNYSINELEPYISGETIKVHYADLYMKYLDNLNSIISRYDYNGDKEFIFSNLGLFNRNDISALIYNLGGVLNHELYFSNLAPHGINEPMGSLKTAIEDKYGSFDNFKEEFIARAKNIRGSGYVFLVLNQNGELDIITLPNQETPYLYGLTPIMALDVWEHAYFLDEKSDKEEYFNNYFEVLNFPYIDNLYEERKIN